MTYIEKEVKLVTCKKDIKRIKKAIEDNVSVLYTLQDMLEEADTELKKVKKIIFE